jgi:hypothetical protein
MNSFQLIQKVSPDGSLQMTCNSITPATVIPLNHAFNAWLRHSTTTCGG